MLPKGSIGVECGEALLKHGYKLKFFNTINFSKSMRYNPMAYMHISYKPLWHTLLERDMRKEDLRLAAGMTTNMIANMSKEGKHISMDTLARICETLNCEITDVIELVPDEPASTGGKEHERIETKNNRKRN